MFRRWRRQRALRKVKPGDGSRLKPYRGWHVLSRSLFFLDLDGPDGEGHQYAVDVNYFEDWKAVLYRDGRQEASATLPAMLPVPGGVIEVDASTWGLRRMHLLPDDGEERQLRPHPRSAEAWRARFGHRFPRASKTLGGAAIVVLLVSLALGLPQIVEWVSHQQIVADRVGTFTSPLTLPAALNTTLLVAGVVAAMERALTLRSHWLIDAESWWLGD